MELITLNMKQQIILLWHQGHSKSEIAQRVGRHRDTVRKYITDYEKKKGNLRMCDNPDNIPLLIDDIVEPPKYDSSTRTNRKLTEDIVAEIEYHLDENNQKRHRGEGKQQKKKIDIYALQLFNELVEGKDAKPSDRYVIPHSVVVELEKKASKTPFGSMWNYFNPVYPSRIDSVDMLFKKINADNDPQENEFFVYFLFAPECQATSYAGTSVTFNKRDDGTYEGKFDYIHRGVPDIPDTLEIIKCNGNIIVDNDKITIKFDNNAIFYGSPGDYAYQDEWVLSKNKQAEYGDMSTNFADYKELRNRIKNGQTGKYQWIFYNY